MNLTFVPCERSSKYAHRPRLARRSPAALLREPSGVLAPFLTFAKRIQHMLNARAYLAMIRPQIDSESGGHQARLAALGNWPYQGGRFLSYTHLAGRCAGRDEVKPRVAALESAQRAAASTDGELGTNAAAATLADCSSGFG